MHLDICARALLAVVFLVATVSKWRDFASFRRSVVAFGVPWPGLTAAVVSAVEATVVVLVIVPATALVGYAVAVIVLSGFIIGITSVLRRKRAVTCRCFGANGGLLRRHHIVRNALLAAVAVAGAGANLVASGAPVARPGTVLAAAAGATIAVLVIRWDDVAFALTPRQKPSGQRAHLSRRSALTRSGR